MAAFWAGSRGLNVSSRRWGLYERGFGLFCPYRGMRHDLNSKIRWKNSSCFFPDDLSVRSGFLEDRLRLVIQSKMVWQLRWCVISEGHEQTKSRHHSSLTQGWSFQPNRASIWLAILSFLKFVFQVC